MAGANDIGAGRALVNLSTTTLLDENERISDALLETPRSPAVHEAAALLLGAFALREAAGWLDDVRPALNRMTAHLTIARVLRGGAAASLDGVVADAVLMTLIGRQSDALILVATIDRGAATDTERAWAAALRLRNTGDWRKSRPLDVETPLEQFEHTRALGDRLGHDALLTYVDGLPESRRDAVDLGRIAMIGSFTVDAGNRFTPHNVARELDEATAIRRRYQQGEVTSTPVIEMLNEPPTARPSNRRRVIDWGLWAGQQQRHLLHASVTAWHHAGNFDGRHDIARLLTQQYSSLALFPIFVLEGHLRAGSPAWLGFRHHGVRFRSEGTEGAPAPAEESMKATKYPAGWDEARVRRVLAHYAQQTDEEAVAEDEAAYESTTHTAMEVPVELVPAVRELLAKRRAS